MNRRAPRGEPKTLRIWSGSNSKDPKRYVFDFMREEQRDTWAVSATLDDDYERPARLIARLHNKPEPRIEMLAADFDRNRVVHAVGASAVFYNWNGARKPKTPNEDW